MQIKICGITRVEDARLAVQLGAEMIGLILTPKSPRYIDNAQAKKIGEAIPKEVEKVGVFVNASHDRIILAIKEIGLTAIQLHGDESPLYVELLKQKLIKFLLPVKIFKMVHSIDKADRFSTPFLLVDARPDGETYGGQGKVSDWELAKKMAPQKNIILAGGLNPQNIQLAMDQDIFALDICSGVESAPGIKDRKKLEELFRNKEEYRELTA